LERIGHVPQDAIKLAEFLSVDPKNIATIFARFENAALGLLISDKGFFKSSNSAAYLKFLTICAAGEIKELRMLDSLQLSLANLPWSMLMMEKRDEVNVIKPVSPLCKKVMQEYIASTPDTWKTVVSVFIPKFVCLTFSCGKMTFAVREKNSAMLHIAISTCAPVGNKQ
jgi:hypothetical protein